MEEIWEDIQNYEGVYQVSNFGNVKSLKFKKEKSLKPILSKKGYETLRLWDKGKAIKHIIHRLVAIAFVENKNDLPFVNHKDKNTTNNIYSNLEWVTNRENDCHKYKEKQTSSSFIGVTWNKKGRKWHSQIKVNKKSIHLGCFDNELEAYQARVDFENKNDIQNRYL